MGELKARIPTIEDKASLLEHSEVMRINKLWMIALHNKLGYTANGILGVYAEVCKIAGELYEDPEYWGTVDELLCDKYRFGEFLPREDVNEREKLAAEIHKAQHKKWRQI